MGKPSIQGTKEGFISWIKTSFEEVSGRASHRKLTTFSFVVLFWIMIALTYINKDPGTFNDFQWGLVFSAAVGMSSLRIIEKRINR